MWSYPTETGDVINTAYGEGGGGGGGGEGGEGGGGGLGHQSGFFAKVFTQSFTMLTPELGPGNLFVPPHFSYAPMEKYQPLSFTVPSIKFLEFLLYSKPLKLRVVVSIERAS